MRQGEFFCGKCDKIMDEENWDGDGNGDCSCRMCGSMIGTMEHEIDRDDGARN